MPVRSNKYVNIRSSDKSNLGNSSGGIVGDYVISVNGKSGNVQLDAFDVNAMPLLKAIEGELVLNDVKLCGYNTFHGQPLITSVNAPNAEFVWFLNTFDGSSVEEIKGFGKVKSGNFYRAFYKCEKLTRISDEAFSEFETGIYYQYGYFYGAFLETFYGTGIKTLPSNAFKKVVRFEQSSGATDYCAKMFSGCFRDSAIEELPEGFLGNIDDSNSNFYYAFTEFYQMFRNSKLKRVPDGMFAKIKYTPYWQFRECFMGCSDLESIPATFFDNILGAPDSDPDHGVYGLANMFNGCPKLEGNIVFKSLIKIGKNMLNGTFAGTKITSVSFPALNTGSFEYADNSSFGSMLGAVDGCVVHFPSNVQSVIGNWSSVTSGFGGTNTTVLFDLPATEN